MRGAGGTLNKGTGPGLRIAGASLSFVVKELILSPAISSEKGKRRQ